MWISGYRWGRLLDRLDALESEVRVLREKQTMPIYSGGRFMPDHSISAFGDYVMTSVNVADVVASLAHDAGLKYCHHPERKEFTTKKC